jgi:hemerythrin-like domain-containing protein
MLNLKQLKDIDPLKRIAEKQSEQEEFSPMDPPDAYSPPGGEQVPYEKMHAFLQELMDEHKACIIALDGFEDVLKSIHENGMNRNAVKGISDFFRFLDERIIPHNVKEEKCLFSRLQERLLEAGEHSQGPIPKTAIDMLEDDHIQALQLAAVTFNFFGLTARLPDPASQALVLDAALTQGKSLVELIRLHIFREDNVVFPLAHKHLSTSEFDEMRPSP